ncbi:hypothetical protein ACFL5X_03445, partial [Candidatus Omnitrophota bacterium]
GAAMYFVGMSISDAYKGTLKGTIGNYIANIGLVLVGIGTLVVLSKIRAAWRAQEVSIPNTVNIFIQGLKRFSESNAWMGAPSVLKATNIAFSVAATGLSAYGLRNAFIVPMINIMHSWLDSSHEWSLYAATRPHLFDTYTRAGVVDADGRPVEVNGDWIAVLTIGAVFYGAFNVLRIARSAYARISQSSIIGFKQALRSVRGYMSDSLNRSASYNWLASMFGKKVAAGLYFGAVSPLGMLFFVIGPLQPALHAFSAFAKSYIVPSSATAIEEHFFNFTIAAFWSEEARTIYQAQLAAWADAGFFARIGLLVEMFGQGYYAGIFGADSDVKTFGQFIRTVINPVAFLREVDKMSLVFAYILTFLQPLAEPVFGNIRAGNFGRIFRATGKGVNETLSFGLEQKIGQEVSRNGFRAGLRGSLARAAHLGIQGTIEEVNEQFIGIAIAPFTTAFLQPLLGVVFGPAVARNITATIQEVGEELLSPGGADASGRSLSAADFWGSSNGIVAPGLKAEVVATEDAGNAVGLRFETTTLMGRQLGWIPRVEGDLNSLIPVYISQAGNDIDSQIFGQGNAALVRITRKEGIIHVILMQPGVFKAGLASISASLRYGLERALILEGREVPVAVANSGYEPGFIPAMAYSPNIGINVEMSDGVSTGVTLPSGILASNPGLLNIVPEQVQLPSGIAGKIQTIPEIQAWVSGNTLRLRDLLSKMPSTLTVNAAGEITSLSTFTPDLGNITFGLRGNSITNVTLPHVLLLKGGLSRIIPSSVTLPANLVQAISQSTSLAGVIVGGQILPAELLKMPSTFTVNADGQITSITSVIKELGYITIGLNGSTLAEIALPASLLNVNSDLGSFIPNQVVLPGNLSDIISNPGTSSQLIGEGTINLRELLKMPSTFTVNGQGQVTSVSSSARGIGNITLKLNNGEFAGITLPGNTVIMGSLLGGKDLLESLPTQVELPGAIDIAEISAIPASLVSEGKLCLTSLLVGTTPSTITLNDQGKAVSLAAFIQNLSSFIVNINTGVENGQIDHSINLPVEVGQIPVGVNSVNPSVVSMPVMPPDGLNISSGEIFTFIDFVEQFESVPQGLREFGRLLEIVEKAIGGKVAYVVRRENGAFNISVNQKIRRADGSFDIDKIEAILRSEFASGRISVKEYKSFVAGLGISLERIATYKRTQEAQLSQYQRSGEVSTFVANVYLLREMIEAQGQTLQPSSLGWLFNRIKALVLPNSPVSYSGPHGNQTALYAKTDIELNSGISPPFSASANPFNPASGLGTTVNAKAPPVRTPFNARPTNRTNPSNTLSRTSSSDHNMPTAAEIRGLANENPDIRAALNQLAYSLQVLQDKKGIAHVARRTNGTITWNISQDEIRRILGGGQEAQFVIDQVIIHEAANGHNGNDAHQAGIQAQLDAIRKSLNGNGQDPAKAAYKKFKEEEENINRKPLGKMLRGLRIITNIYEDQLQSIIRGTDEYKHYLAILVGAVTEIWGGVKENENQQQKMLEDMADAIYRHNNFGDSSKLTPHVIAANTSAGKSTAAVIALAEIISQGKLKGVKRLFFFEITDRLAVELVGNISSLYIKTADALEKVNPARARQLRQRAEQFKHISAREINKVSKGKNSIKAKDTPVMSVESLQTFSAYMAVNRNDPVAKLLAEMLKDSLAVTTDFRTGPALQLSERDTEVLSAQEIDPKVKLLQKALDFFKEVFGEAIFAPEFSGRKGKYRLFRERTISGSDAVERVRLPYLGLALARKFMKEVRHGSLKKFRSEEGDNALKFIHATYAMMRAILDIQNKDIVYELDAEGKVVIRPENDDGKAFDVRDTDSYLALARAMIYNLKIEAGTINAHTANTEGRKIDIENEGVRIQKSGHSRISLARMFDMFQELGVKSNLIFMGPETADQRRTNKATYGMEYIRGNDMQEPRLGDVLSDEQVTLVGEKTSKAVKGQILKIERVGRKSGKSIIYVYVAKSDELANPEPAIRLVLDSESNNTTYRFLLNQVGNWVMAEPGRPWKERKVVEAFKVEDGKVIALDKEGNAITVIEGISDKAQVGKTMPVSEAVTKLLRSQQHKGDVRVFITRSNEFGIDFSKVPRANAMLRGLADTRTDILPLRQGLARLRPDDDTTNFSMVDLGLLVFGVKENTIQEARRIEGLEKIFIENQRETDLKDRYEKRMELARDAKFKYNLLLANKIGTKKARKMIAWINKVWQEHDFDRQSQNLFGDVELSIDHFKQEEEFSTEALRTAWHPQSGELGREFYTANKEVEALIDVVLFPQNLEEKGWSQEAREVEAIFKDRPANKQLTPEQVGQVFNVHFTSEDYPKYAAASIEGGHTVTNLDKGRPGSGAALVPSRLSEAYPELGVDLESLTPEQKALFYSGEYLVGNGALNLAMQSLQRLTKDSREALNSLLPLLGIGDYRLPVWGSLIGNSEAYILIKRLALGGIIDLASYRQRGLDSLIALATLIAPFVNVLNFSSQQTIFADELKRLQQKQYTPAEFIRRNLKPGYESLEKALRAIEQKYSSNIFKNKVQLKHLIRVVAAVASDDEADNLFMLLPSVLSLGIPNVTPATVKVFEVTHALFSRPGYIKQSAIKKMEKLTIWEYSQLAFDMLARAQFHSENSDSALVKKAAEGLIEFMMDYGVVNRSTLQSFIDRPKETAQRLGLDEAYVNRVAQELQKNVLSTATIKKTVKYKDVLSGLRGALHSGVSPYLELRKLGISPELEYGLKHDDIEDFLAKKKWQTDEEKDAFYNLIDPDLKTSFINAGSDVFGLSEVKTFLTSMNTPGNGAIAEALKELGGFTVATPFYRIFKAMEPALQIIAQRELDASIIKELNSTWGISWSDSAGFKVTIVPPGSLKGPMDASATAQVQPKDGGVKLDAKANFDFNLDGNGALSVNFNLMAKYNLLHEFDHLAVKKIGADPVRIVIPDDPQAQTEARNNYAALLEKLKELWGFEELTDEKLELGELTPNEDITDAISTLQALKLVRGDERLQATEAAMSGSGFTGHINDLLWTEQNVDAVMLSLAKLSATEILERVFIFNKERRAFRDKKLEEGFAGYKERAKTIINVMGRVLRENGIEVRPHEKAAFYALIRSQAVFSDALANYNEFEADKIDLDRDAVKKDDLVGLLNLARILVHDGHHAFFVKKEQSDPGFAAKKFAQWQSLVSKLIDPQLAEASQAKIADSKGLGDKPYDHSVIDYQKRVKSGDLELSKEHLAAIRQRITGTLIFDQNDERNKAVVEQIDRIMAKEVISKEDLEALAKLPLVKTDLGTALEFFAPLEEILVSPELFQKQHQDDKNLIILAKKVRDYSQLRQFIKELDSEINMPQIPDLTSSPLGIKEVAGNHNSQLGEIPLTIANGIYGNGPFAEMNMIPVAPMGISANIFSKDGVPVGNAFYRSLQAVEDDLGNERRVAEVKIVNDQIVITWNSRLGNTLAEIKGEIERIFEGQRITTLSAAGFMNIVYAYKTIQGIELYKHRDEITANPARLAELKIKATNLANRSLSDNIDAIIENAYDLKKILALIPDIVFDVNGSRSVAVIPSVGSGSLQTWTPATTNIQTINFGSVSPVVAIDVVTYQLELMASSPINAPPAFDQRNAEVSSPLLNHSALTLSNTIGRNPSHTEQVTKSQGHKVTRSHVIIQTSASPAVSSPIETAVRDIKLPSTGDKIGPAGTNSEGVFYHSGPSEEFAYGTVFKVFGNMRKPGQIAKEFRNMVAISVGLKRIFARPVALNGTGIESEYIPALGTLQQIIDGKVAVPAGVNIVEALTTLLGQIAERSKNRVGMEELIEERIAENHGRMSYEQVLALGKELSALPLVDDPLVGIIYPQDMNPDNILLTHDGQLKMVDTGMSLLSGSKIDLVISWNKHYNHRG